MTISPLLIMLITLGTVNVLANSPALDFEADSITYDHENQSSHYEGHVRVKVKLMTIKADQMHLQYPEDQEKQQLTLKGSPVLLQAEQNKQPSMQSKTMTIYPGQGLLVLKDKVELKTGIEQLHCQSLRYHFTPKE